jgi:hypothetical protein
MKRAFIMPGLSRNIAFLFLFFTGCHSADVVLYQDTSGEFYRFPPTNHVTVLSDLNMVEREYIEIGYIEAKGGWTVGKQSLINDMIKKAKEYGADAIIKQSFYEESEYNELLETSVTKNRARAILIRYISRPDQSPSNNKTHRKS